MTFHTYKKKYIYIYIYFAKLRHQQNLDLCDTKYRDFLRNIWSVDRLYPKQSSTERQVVEGNCRVHFNVHIP